MLLSISRKQQTREKPNVQLCTYEFCRNVFPHLYMHTKLKLNILKVEVIVYEIEYNLQCNGNR